ncbi:hypothetical protein [Rhizobium sp. RAF56]|uniref:hypothetical protein n=1 Tax=Rhizobium sp. RAF56 TaxID=3233062 RepID=UPI003F9A1E52
MRRFRPYRAGVPAHDHLGDILASLDAEQFQRCFVGWVASVAGLPKAWLPSTARRSAVPRARARVRKRSTWFQPSPPASVWWWDRSRWRAMF